MHLYLVGYISQAYMRIGRALRGQQLSDAELVWERARAVPKSRPRLQIASHFSYSVLAPPLYRRLQGGQYGSRASEAMPQQLSRAVL